MDVVLALEQGLDVVLALEQVLDVVLALEQGLDVVLALEQGLDTVPALEQGLDTVPALEQGLARQILDKKLAFEQVFAGFVNVQNGFLFVCILDQIVQFVDEGIRQIR